MSTIKVSWKCDRLKSEPAAQFCEELMIQAAQLYGMDTAIIRHGPHNTTRWKGRRVKTVWHITGDILDSSKEEKTGYALHWNLADDQRSLLVDYPEPGSPNPQVWAL
ncbi:hypothetical protein DFH06DRAFT_1196068 [Mycena polygramma]|nr:hypothetical protein DFH06DRAFT_1196068 [Mycena polygramma]